MIPKSFIEEITRKTDIVPLIREYVPLEEQKGKLLTTYPFCHYYGFTVSPGKNIFKCFRCQKGGGPFAFVQLTSGEVLYRGCKVSGRQVGDGGSWGREGVNPVVDS